MAQPFHSGNPTLGCCRFRGHHLRLPGVDPVSWATHREARKCPAYRGKSKVWEILTSDIDFEARSQIQPPCDFEFAMAFPACVHIASI